MFQWYKNVLSDRAGGKETGNACGGVFVCGGVDKHLCTVFEYALVSCGVRRHKTGAREGCVSMKEWLKC